jgi:hypothetical protein
LKINQDGATERQSDRLLVRVVSGYLKKQTCSSAVVFSQHSWGQVRFSTISIVHVFTGQSSHAGRRSCFSAHVQELQLLPALSDGLAKDAEIHPAQLDQLLTLRLVQR